MATPENPPVTLTAGGLLRRNAILNLVGLGTPAVAAILVAPLLIRGLGLERFGVLALVWMLMGYFSLVDVGIGPALARAVSAYRGVYGERWLAALAWTSLLLSFLLGLLGGAAVFVIAPSLVEHVVHMSEELRAEAVMAARLLGLALPVITVNSTFIGILSAEQRFGVINSVRAPVSVASVAGPLLILPFTPSLVGVVLLLIALRVIGMIAFAAGTLRCVPWMRGPVALDRSALQRVLPVGKWLTVTNIVSPLMVYLDRFILAGRLSVIQVAFYAAPFELVSRLWLLSMPIGAVLFPAFAATYETDRERCRKLYVQGWFAMMMILLPGALVFACLAPEILRLWLGSDFARTSTRVLQWLAAGVFVNGVAQLALALVQAAGRADLGAKLHLMEVIPYLGSVWWLTGRLGIEGTALAWVGRALIDAVVLFIIASRLLQLPFRDLFRGRLAELTLAASVPFALLPWPLPVRAGILGVTMAVWSGLALRHAGLLLPLMRRSSGSDGTRVGRP